MNALVAERREMTLAPAWELPSLENVELKLPRWLASVLALAVVFAATAIALEWRDPRLHRLHLEGRFERVSALSVQQAVEPALGQGFFGVDVAAVREQVTRLPWVARARVERRWPSGLDVRVWEREPLARWNDGSLLDVDAVAFTPADVGEPALQRLPELAGPEGNERLVADSFRQLSAAVESTPLALSGLRLDARGEWTAQTRLGIELRLGSEPVGSKIDVITGALLAAVGNRLDEVAYVDLRYTNGFAIGWVSARDAGRASGDTPHG